MKTEDNFNMKLEELNKYMTLRDLHQYCVEMSEKHPQHAENIRNLYFLACDEVEDGSSVEHECELAISDIKDLING